MPTNRAWTGT
uniref:Uncharacterized protein n=1 Tax=Arundo donax TaxID=35708 RepID=A0A0A9ATB7_ARUDO